MEDTVNSKEQIPVVGHPEENKGDDNFYETVDEDGQNTETSAAPKSIEPSHCTEIDIPKAAKNDDEYTRIKSFKFTKLEKILLGVLLLSALIGYASYPKQTICTELSSSTECPGPSLCQKCQLECPKLPSFPQFTPSMCKQFTRHVMKSTAHDLLRTIQNLSVALQVQEEKLLIKQQMLETTLGNFKVQAMHAVRKMKQQLDE